MVEGHSRLLRVADAERWNVTCSRDPQTSRLCFIPCHVRVNVLRNGAVDAAWSADIFPLTTTSHHPITMPISSTIKVAAIALAAVFVSSGLIKLSYYNSLDPSTYSQRFASVFSKCSSSTTFSNEYDHPQDLIVPAQPHPGIGPESFIGKVTAVFHGRDPTLIRAIQTHQVHNRRYGYPLLVLRHRILDDTWSKPAYILAVLLEEMRKPENHRLKWLMCARLAIE